MHSLGKRCVLSFGAEYPKTPDEAVDFYADYITKDIAKKANCLKKVKK